MTTSNFQFTGEELDTALGQWMQEQIDAGAPLQLAATKRTHAAEFFASKAAAALLATPEAQSS